MKKICERCKKDFECNNSKNCWCSSVELSEWLAKYLKKNYTDCLCKNCLLQLKIVYSENKS